MVLYGLDHLTRDVILYGTGVGILVYVGITYLSTL